MKEESRRGRKLYRSSPKTLGTALSGVPTEGETRRMKKVRGVDSHYELLHTESQNLLNKLSEGERVENGPPPLVLFCL